MNPICIVGFALAARFFFKDRIPYEEELLVEFFGDQYVNYALKTPIRIPGVSGLIKYDPK